MNSQPAPFSVLLDLGTIPEQGVEKSFEPNATERAALAEWLGISAVERLTATVRIVRPGDDHYRYEAAFAADVVQACVVTLDPVPAHLKGRFTREYYLEGRTGTRKAPSEKTKELTHIEDDEPEVLSGSILDLAAPVLEELSLALDPYPRAPGVSFTPPEEPVAPAENPFAVLEQLKLKPGETTKKPSGSAKNRTH